MYSDIHIEVVLPVHKNESNIQSEPHDIILLNET